MCAGEPPFRNVVIRSTAHDAHDAVAKAPVANRTPHGSMVRAIHADDDAASVHQRASPSPSLHTRPAVKSQRSKPARALADHRQEDSWSNGRLALDVAAAIHILVLMPVWYIRIMSLRACPCHSSAPGKASCLQLPPWLSSFPCGQSGLQQLAWWSTHWWPATQLLLVSGGEWDGAWLQLGAVAVLVLAATRGGTAQYQKYRTPVLITWRLGLVLLALLALVVNTWVAPGALPLAGAHFDRATMWGATRLLWATQLQAVPARHHMWVAPIEFLGMTACALLARASQRNPAAVSLIALQLLLVGGFIPMALLHYTGQATRRARRLSAPACTLPYAAAAASGCKTLAAAGVSSAGSDAAKAGSDAAKAAGRCCGSPSSDTRAHMDTSNRSASLRKEICLRLPQGSGTTAPLLSSIHTDSKVCNGDSQSQAAIAAEKKQKPVAKLPVYKSRLTTRLVSVKVRNPSPRLQADPSPLVSAVTAAVANAAQPGTVILGVDHAVFKGCIQIVTWVHSVDLQSDSTAARDAAEIQSAAEEAARQLVGSGGGVDSTVAVGPAVNGGMGTASAQGCCWVDWENGVDSLQGVQDCQQFGGAQPALVVRMAGEGLVGWVQASGGSVRVVVVGDEDGAVLADGKVQGRMGFWHGVELGAVGLSTTILSFRVPIDLSTTASTTTPVSSAHLVILPVDDTCGEVLWSTPLLLGLPPVVATQLHQLHATMANYLLEDSSPGSWSFDLQPAEALGQAYEQHIVPLLHDILVCCQPAHAASSQDDMAQQQLARQQVIDDVVGFFEGCGPSMSATLAWLKPRIQQASLGPLPTAAATLPPLCHPASWSIEPAASAAPTNSASSCICSTSANCPCGGARLLTPDPSSPFPTPSATTLASPSAAPPSTSLADFPTPSASPSPSTAPPSTSPADPTSPSEPPSPPASSLCHRAHERPLTAVLLGSFCSPCTEARYQEYLSASTATTDATLRPVQLLMLAASCYKAPLANSIIAGSHLLAQLLLHLLLCGSSRSPSRRRVAVRAMMALVVLHFLCYNLLAPYPGVLMEVWHRKPWIPTCIYGVFHLAGHQAGFIQTTAFAAVVALQLALILRPQLTGWQLVARTTPVWVLASMIGFFADLAHRARFMATPAALEHCKHQ